MRITQATVERLAVEAERVTGKAVLESITRPGDGTTHYVMAESMVSTYLGSRRAAAYLLGVLTGAHPEGQIHVAAFHAGYQYGRAHRR